MTRLYRIGAALLLALTGLMLWTPAQAAFPTQTIRTGYVIGQDGNTVYPSADAACTAAAGSGHTGTLGTTYPYPHFIQLHAQCEVVRNSDSQSLGTVGIFYRETPNSCPAGSTASGGQCVCTAPNVQNATNNGCDAPDVATCNAAKLTDSTAFGPREVTVTGKTPSGPVCMPVPGLTPGKGCQVNFKRDMSIPNKDGVWESFGTYSFGPTTAPCNAATPTPEEPKPAEPTTCKGDQGQVNGVDVCIPHPENRPSETEKKTEKEVVTPQGTTTTTESSTTICNAAGSCTTTTITSVNNGTTTEETTKTETQDKGSYCKASPQSPECGTGSGFSGNCEAGFSFKGDAIQGAIAREIHKQNCLMNAETEESALYDAAKANTGDQTTDLPGNETKSIGSGDIDQTNAITGGSCIADRTLNMNIGITTLNLVLPFSSICPLLDYFRLVLIALGFFIAYRIIGGR